MASELPGAAIRRLAGQEDGTPEGRLKNAVTASIGTMSRGVTFARYGSPELRMKHYVRLRAALLALADELDQGEEPADGG